MSSNKRNALGRGLSALLEDSKTDITNSKTEMGSVVGSVTSIPLEQIEANPFQPRTQFEKEALVELSESIAEHGIIQPVTVRKLGYDKYQLISGERRFRASKLAGLKTIPAYIRIANDQAMLEMAIVENIQRENLDSIEVAISYQRLIEECNLTQDALSKKVSKQRSTITNFLRLLKLPAEIQVGIRDGKISMGHAKTLINIADDKKQIDIYNHIIQEDLSVRESEELVRGEKKSTGQKLEKKSDNPAKGNVSLSFEQQKAMLDLSNMLNSKTDLKINTKGKGKIVLEFESLGDLQRIFDILDI
ncbi:MAG: ParB/RepB/Spo0J family partition protein [Bacteroidetes bacterium]|nr:ParB/RepB/Spo0J family partition protein [Bacteroidota bacterium]HET6244378.1 ParB/RepB/Spo0J family partition protein [Bacteroidia bacterium]